MIKTTYTGSIMHYIERPGARYPVLVHFAVEFGESWESGPPSSRHTPPDEPRFQIRYIQPSVRIVFFESGRKTSHPLLAWEERFVERYFMKTLDDRPRLAQYIENECLKRAFADCGYDTVT